MPFRYAAALRLRRLVSADIFAFSLRDATDIFAYVFLLFLMLYDYYFFFRLFSLC